MQNKDTKTYLNRRLEGLKMGKIVVPNYTREIAMEHCSLAGFVPDVGFPQSPATFAFSTLSFGSETMF